MALIYGLGLDPSAYKYLLRLSKLNNNYLLLVPYGCIAFIWCFFPCAGYLADVKYGRYKTVVFSSYICILSLFFPIMLPLAILVSYVAFTANVVQFGMDQLHDSPGEDRTLFIHWYTWIHYVSIFFTQLVWILLLKIDSNEGILVCLLVLFTIVLLIIPMCISRHRRRWFVIEHGRANPYKLIYKVTKFAFQHRTPIHRSAFTYCENELPMGLNLAKEKYGGFFTTEEVEDVKAFYGIIKVLLSLGPIFFIDKAANSLRGFYSYSSFITSEFLIEDQLSLLLIGICIPFYLLLLRPLVSHYIPGMLKRMGIGMFMILLSLIVTLSIDVGPDFVFHRNSTDTAFGICNKENLTVTGDTLLIMSETTLVVQNILSALANMLIYISVFEFICSQSPYSMTGQLIGMYYTIKGLFQLIASAFIVPFFLTCYYGNWLTYFLLNIVIGVVAIIVYICIARKYKYRERDEPCNIHQYAEDYYSNPQQEKYYDYD